MIQNRGNRRSSFEIPVTSGAVTRKRVDDIGAVDFSDAIIVQIGNKDVAFCIHGHFARRIQLRRCCRSAVSRESGSATAGDWGDGRSLGKNEFRYKKKNEK